MTKALGGKSALSDKDEAFELCPELRSFEEEFSAYESLLRKWQSKINLVAEATLPTIWTRHFADSAQILDVATGHNQWADLGSGAGFPGMVLAICLKRKPGAEVHLIESDQRKVAFLRAVSRETEAPAIVHLGRIESELPKLNDSVSAITARALAPLPQLIDWSRDLLLKNVLGVFLKGEDWLNELTLLQQTSNFQFKSIASRTNSRARLILAARDFKAIEASSCPNP